MAANLPITDNDTVIQYTSIGESIFTFPFPYLDDAEIKVSVDQVLQTIATHYTLSGLGDAGGTVTFVAPTIAGEIITIWQDMPFKRLTGFALGAATLVAEDLNTEFIRQVRHDQQMRRDVRRTLRIAVDDTQAAADMTLPVESTRAGKALAFDASGKPTVLTLVSSEDASLRADLASTLASLGFNLVAITKTAAEISAGATIVNAHIEVGNILRYGNNTTPGVTDMSVAFTAAAAVMTPASAFVPQGTYLVVGTIVGAFHSLAGVTISSGTVNTIIDLTATLPVLPELKIKTADESKPTDITLADDLHLAGFALEAATRYVVEGWIQYQQNVGDIKWKFNFDNNPIAFSRISHNVTDQSGTRASNSVLILGATTAITTMTDGDEDSIWFRGYIESHATLASIMDFQWAQNTSDANATIIREGSWLELTKT